jgi:hypothetical protein
MSAQASHCFKAGVEWPSLIEDHVGESIPMSEMESSEQGPGRNFLLAATKNWICHSFQWKGKATYALTAMYATAAIFLLGAVFEMLTFNSHALIYKACNMSFNVRCQDEGRDGSLGFYFLFVCLVLGMLQIGEVAKPTSKCWRALSKIENYLNEKVMRFSLSLSVVGVNLMLVSTFVAIFTSDRMSFGVSSVMQIFIEVAFLVVFVAFDLELWANWSRVKGKFGNVLPGLLIAALTYGFIEARAWAGWTWGGVVIALGVAAGMTTVWKWLLRGN